MSRTPHGTGNGSAPVDLPVGRPHPAFDPRTGRPVPVGNHHRPIFVPLQYVGVVGGLAALGVAVPLVVA